MHNIEIKTDSGKELERFEDYLCRRNEDISNMIHDLINTMVNTSDNKKELVDWDMAYIGNIAAYIDSLLESKGIYVCYPYYTHDGIDSTDEYPCYKDDDCKNKNCPFKK